ncbi:MAG: transcriptional regulator Brz [Halorhabdus sp.]
MGIETLTCPDCGAEIDMGLPRSATVKSVASDRREEPDDPRVKVRPNVCPNDHRFYITFAF